MKTAGEFLMEAKKAWEKHRKEGDEEISWPFLAGWLSSVCEHQASQIEFLSRNPEAPR